MMGFRNCVVVSQKIDRAHSSITPGVVVLRCQLNLGYTEASCIMVPIMREKRKQKNRHVCCCGCSFCVSSLKDSIGDSHYPSQMVPFPCYLCYYYALPRFLQLERICDDARQCESYASGSTKISPPGGLLLIVDQPIREKISIRSKLADHVGYTYHVVLSSGGAVAVTSPGTE